MRQKLLLYLLSKLFITRVEIIDEEGRAYTRMNCHTDLYLQDHNHTLKVMVSQASPGEIEQIEQYRKANRWSWGSTR